MRMRMRRRGVGGGDGVFAMIDEEKSLHASGTHLPGSFDGTGKLCGNKRVYDLGTVDKQFMCEGMSWSVAHLNNENRVCKDLNSGKEHSIRLQTARSLLRSHCRLSLAAIHLQFLS